jgi:Stress responsive A/B Barrel Domain
MKNLQEGFVHTVFFWLKEPNNLESQTKLKAGLLKLAEISEIKQAYVGRPASTNREVIDSSYDFSITFIFNNKTDQDIYQDHPDHHAFIADCAELWEKVRVFDAC